MNVENALAVMATAVVAGGCAIPAAMIAASHGGMPGHQFVPPTHDVPPQVIYRIDNNRYLTLENYDSCSNDGMVFYNDAVKNIRTKIRDYPLGFQGKVLLDPADGILAFPISPGPSPYACGDRGCSMAIIYSFDNGRTFRSMRGWRLPSPQIKAYEETRNLTVAVKAAQLYIITKTRAVQWKLDRDDHPEMPQGQTLEGGLSQVPKISTLSGQDRYSCDDTIRPKAKK